MSLVRFICWAHIIVKPNFKSHIHIRAVSSFKRPFVPSPEQVAIVDAFKWQNVNVMVSARPGAGKTATAEAVVAANPEVPTAIVTYSKRLQLDTQRRLENYGSADVFTFHALASKLFGTLVNNDLRLRQLRDRAAQPVWTPPYGILILDELQDLTEILYWLTCTLISRLAHSLPTPPRLLVLGDPRQAIYEFRGADARYLELASDTFSGISPYSWRTLKLAKSFRLSHQTANFVNMFIGDNYIKGSHNGPRPLYLHADVMDVNAILGHIIPIIRKYSPNNCAVIAPSVRNNPPLARLTNLLSGKYRIPVAISTSDDMPLDSDVLHGKVAVCSYHQFKGSERDAVIVYGADASYFRFMARDLPDNCCPNATFVALTRAIQQLVVIQSHESPAMPFVPWSKMKDTWRFVNLVKQDPRPQSPPGRPLQLGLLLPRNVAVTEISRHVQDETLEQLIKKYLSIKELASPMPASMQINVADKVLTNKRKRYHEAVSDLSGLAITAAFEWEVSRRCTTFGYVSKTRPSIPSEAPARSRWFAREAARYETRQSNYKSRLLQMKGHAFNWLDEHLEATTARLSEQFTDPSLLGFEVSMSGWFKVQEVGQAVEPFQSTQIAGRADIVERNPANGAPPTIWEIKFVSSLSLEHVAQLVIYGYLWATSEVAKERSHKAQTKACFPRLILFNIRDGAKWEISTTQEGAMALTEGLLRAKYTASGGLPTQSFLRRCEEVRKEVMVGMDEDGFRDASDIPAKRRRSRMREVQNARG